MNITLDSTGPASAVSTFNLDASASSTVSLTTRGNATGPFSGFMQVQSSDNLARFAADGTPIYSEPTLINLGYDNGTGQTGTHNPLPPTSTFAPYQPYDFYTPNYINGYHCQGCGVWVPNGTIHNCGNTMPWSTTVTTFPKIEMKPHKCPVCDGKSQVPFNPENPLVTDRERTSWPCKPCSGTGVLWQ